MRLFICIIVLSAGVFAQKIELTRDFHLGGRRSVEAQYFHIHNHYIKYAQDGDRSSQEFYDVLLSCQPGMEGDTYTVHRFTTTLNNEEKEIPALKDWSYLFNPGQDGLDEHGNVLCIPHSRFENLTTADGKTLSTEHSYAVYNSFIDFHGFNDVFSRSMDGGQGIEDLKNIGDQIIHDSAYSEPPVNLGQNIKEGSVFRNGQVVLRLKGISRINNKTCALVGFDSGESSFTMKIEAMKDMIVTTNGSSHYSGDLYIDLESNWTQRTEMIEFVVSQTKIPNMDMTVPGIIERQVSIRNINKDELTNLLH